MATVGMMSSNMTHSNDVPKSMDLPPSPSNSVPFIIATSADEEKPEKAVAPVNGGSPMRYLQASSKLDLEPNPFEQSFSGMSGKGSDSIKVETPKPVLPPIASMSGRLAPNSDQYGWDAQSLRMGPLSPSMLEGPQNPIVFDKPSSQNPVPVGSFPTSSASLSTVFNSPLGQVPFTGLPGPLPAPPAAVMSESYPIVPPPYNHNQVHNQGTQPQQFTHPAHPPMNRYMAQGQSHPENDQGNLHLLSQAQAAVRESWTKRESTDQNGGAHGPHYTSQPPHQQHHSHHQQNHQHHQHQHQHSQHHPSHHQGPPQTGQSLPGMPGMVAAPQMPKNGVEPAFVRGVRRPRVASEDNSDDSEFSRQSGNGDEGNPNKKKNTGAVDDKMDEEEKRKNFLERNRQAALKCRQRKKQWLSNLQAKVEYLSTDNEHLQNQTAMLRDEIIHLKALLLAHKDCPVAQANGVYADAIGIPNHGGMPPHGRHPMQQPQQGGRGPALPRGHPPPPQPHHHHSPSMQHGPLQGSNGMSNGSNNSNNSGPRMAHPPATVPGSMVVAGPNRPMSMMQDITPNASPSHNQTSVRY
ncbi:hypothetical protein CPB97_003083 [Podila verticillata]|nr:hypothetical protein CPB97_003083 [Podila verticillata]